MSFTVFSSQMSSERYLEMVFSLAQAIGAELPLMRAISAVRPLMNEIDIQSRLDGDVTTVRVDRIKLSKAHFAGTKAVQNLARDLIPSEIHEIKSLEKETAA